MRKLLYSFLLSLPAIVCNAQQANSLRLEPAKCIYKADSEHNTRCGYLVVPENRHNIRSRLIKLPYIYVESNKPDKKPDPVLFSGGGPGLSSLHPVTSIARRSLLRDRDYIAFEQRGTHYADPNLECAGVGKAIQQAYLDQRSPDDAVILAVRACHTKLLQQGVDLSAYNTDESVTDIEDLRRLLRIESLNLMGISYSGGLMMAVTQKYPAHIRALVLDSPLPEFVNIDEQELANFNEVLTMVLGNGEDNLIKRFHDYFRNLDGKVFIISYRLKDGTLVPLHYGRAELLQILHGKIEDYDGVKELPQIVGDMIGGQQERYVKAFFDGVFSSNGSISGMRLSVYCSDKMAFADPATIRQQEIAMPWLRGFHVNDVYGNICRAWPVHPINSSTKKPFYSDVPVLLGAGGLDDSCRPLYNDMIHHYFPNSQRLLFTKRQHGPLLNSLEGDIYIDEFLDNPSAGLAGQKEILALDGKNPQ